MRSLQLPDLANQLAGHSDQKLGRLLEMVAILDQELPALREASASSGQDYKASIQRMRGVLSERAQTQQANKPVARTNMSEGDIELF